MLLPYKNYLLFLMCTLLLSPFAVAADLSEEIFDDVRNVTLKEFEAWLAQEQAALATEIKRLNQQKGHTENQVADPVTYQPKRPDGTVEITLLPSGEPEIDEVRTELGKYLEKEKKLPPSSSSLLNDLSFWMDLAKKEMLKQYLKKYGKPTKFNLKNILNFLMDKEHTPKNYDDISMEETLNKLFERYKTWKEKRSRTSATQELVQDSSTGSSAAFQQQLLAEQEEEERRKKEEEEQRRELEEEQERKGQRELEEQNNREKIRKIAEEKPLEITFERIP